METAGDGWGDGLANCVRGIGHLGRGATKLTGAAPDLAGIGAGWAASLGSAWRARLDRPGPGKQFWRARQNRFGPGAQFSFLRGLPEIKCLIFLRTNLAVD